MNTGNKPQNNIKGPRITLTNILGENEFMLFDINTGSGVLVRDGVIVATTTISPEDIEKAKQTYGVDNTP